MLRSRKETPAGLAQEDQGESPNECGVEAPLAKHIGQHECEDEEVRDAKDAIGTLREAPRQRKLAKRRGQDSEHRKLHVPLVIAARVPKDESREG